MSVFGEITITILVATVVAFIMRLLRQPLIVGYILAGIIAGPIFLNIVHSYETIYLFSKIGITILLFIVGLGLNPIVIKEVGKTSVITGVGQVVFTSLIGFLIALTLGIERTAAMYIAIALTFSSTIIILKLLSDKGDIYTLYGKIAIGFLLVQDIIATLILLFLPLLGGGSLNLSAFVLILAKGITLGGVLLLTQKLLLGRLVSWAARNSELLFLFSLSWGLGISVLFMAVGFSIEIGALIAGVMLSTVPYSTEIGARLKPLRDFFIVLFFILLGAQMDLNLIVNILPTALVFSLFVLIGNPIIVIILMNLLGYKTKTGFKAGLTVAQISEFSLILATLGFQIGHLSSEVVSLITLVGLITIAGSTYLIIYSEKIYPKVESLLKLLSLKKQDREILEHLERNRIIIFGCGRSGWELAFLFKRSGEKFIVADINPETIKALESKNIPYIFGDAHSPDFLEELNLEKVKMIISTIPKHETNLLLLEIFRRKNKDGIAVIVSQNAKEAMTLYDHGADYVLVPFYVGAEKIASLIKKHKFNKYDYRKQKELHMDSLEAKVGLA